MRVGQTFRSEQRGLLGVLGRGGILALLLMSGYGAVSGCVPGKTPLNSATPASMDSASAGSASKAINFKSAEGWSLVGDLYSPSGTSQGTVVLLHQRGGSASDWVPLCLALQKAGITALAIDQRGAGRSTEGPGPTGDDAPWQTSGDIAAAINTLKGSGPFALAGASYGANNALIYAAAHPQQIQGVALFSPGSNYNGLDALTPAHSYRGAMAIYHYRNDTIAKTGPQEIDRASTSRDHTLHLYDGSGHGTDLLTPTVTKDAVRFFQRILSRSKS